MLIKFLLVTLISFQATALEKRRSTYKPLEQIGNAHSLHPDDRVIRGAEPIGHVGELKTDGVTDVIIFKNETKTEVTDEVEELKKAGFQSSSIHRIPFKWKDVVDFKIPCEQTIKALSIIKDVLKSKNRKVYFHCTVGEDRTGMLAGLYRMVFENWDVEKAFSAEMCYHGYADGNAKKPAQVARDVDQNLTPVFIRMAYLIKQKKLSRENLDVALCAEDPLQKASAADLQKYNLDVLNCN